MHLSTMDCKPSPQIEELIKSLDDTEWQSSLYSLLQNQTFNQVEVDMFELMCEVLDQNIFAQVDWARNSCLFKELEVGVQMRLLQDSWSEMMILDHIYHRMHNNLPDETELPNGQKFKLLNLALLGVPSMAEKFFQVSENLKQLCFDSADYVCLKLIIPLNAGLVRDFNNKQHLYERIQQAHQILLEYCQTCYPNVPVSTTFPVFFVMSMLMTHVMLMHMTSIRVQSMTIFATIMRGSLLQVAVI